MGRLDLDGNPFRVLTPEGMDAEDMYELFVPVSGLDKIRDPGHTMLKGPRGSGKSMIFRFLEPDCQLVRSGLSLETLPFFGVLVSIKNTSPNLTEFSRLANQYAEIILNEHVLTVFVAAKVFSSVVSAVKKAKVSSEWDTAARDFFSDSFIRRLRECGWTEERDLPSNANVESVFSHCESVCATLYQRTNDYAKRLSFPGSIAVPYESALCDYIGFMHPLLKELSGLPFMPDCPFYLLIDDADYLSNAQTKVLNSWVATRTQQHVSIKISTQLRYKTYATISGPPIQTPHDYPEIKVGEISTTRNSRYKKNIEEILKKRFEKVNIDCSPSDFFPPYEKQETAIQKIEDQLRAAHTTSGRGYRASDDVTRYARPDYIKGLGGPAKQTSSYSYSGFDQLVHISSGLVRFFLEPAAHMYSEELARLGKKSAPFIRPTVQNQVIRQEADTLMFSEFDKLIGDRPEDSSTNPLTEALQKKTIQLQNLIRALGGTFNRKLVSDDAERRVFSVAISGIPDPELLEVFDLGLQYGYFHESSIGNKDGTGRTRLYVLIRRLAPHFNLDPSSFAGYLWVSSELLCEGMKNPDKLLRKIKRSGFAGIDTMQLALFE